MKTLAIALALALPSLAVAGTTPEPPLRVAVGLTRDTAGLEAFAIAVSNPAGRAYGRYASIGALAAQFGATPATVRAVRAELRSIGVVDTTLDVTHGFLIAIMTPEQADAFRPGKGVQDPTLVTDLTVGAPQLRPSVARETERRMQEDGSASTDSVVWPSRTGTATGCAAGTSVPTPKIPEERAAYPNALAFTPNQFGSAFGFAPMRRAGIGGQGVHIALFEADGGYLPGDMTAYAECFGLPVPNLRAVPVGQSTLIDPASGAATIETTLDIQAVMTAAPLARISVVEGTAAASFPEILSAALDARRMKGLPDVISVSYGICESVVQSGDMDLIAGPAARHLTDWVAATAAGAGVSMVTSTGDSGAAGCAHLIPVIPQSAPSSLAQMTTNWASYPATSPWFTAVGGIDMTLTRSNHIRGASAWNDVARIGLPAITPAVIDGAPVYTFSAGGGGGGSSLVYGLPSYQQRFGIISNRRLVPDVSMFAARGIAVYCSAMTSQPGLGCGAAAERSTPWVSVAGTSLAAPLFASAVALANQATAKTGRANVGLANPLLYGRGRAALIDVASGNNDLFGTGRCCYAGRGYDQATGLGWANASAFVAVALTGRLPRG